VSNNNVHGRLVTIVPHVKGLRELSKLRRDVRSFRTNGTSFGDSTVRRTIENLRNYHAPCFSCTGRPIKNVLEWRAPVGVPLRCSLGRRYETWSKPLGKGCANVGGSMFSNLISNCRIRLAISGALRNKCEPWRNHRFCEQTSDMLITKAELSEDAVNCR
jgi:hypothetical protein